MASTHQHLGRAADRRRTSCATSTSAGVRTRVLRAGSRPRPGAAARHRRPPGGVRPRHRPLAEHFTRHRLRHGRPRLERPARTGPTRSTSSPTTSSACSTRWASTARTCPASRWAAGWPPGPRRTTRTGSTRLVLNTPGNIANKPEVMAAAAGPAPSPRSAIPSDATVRAPGRVAVPRQEQVTDELVRLRQAVYSRPGFLRAIENILVLQDPEVRKDFAWGPDWVGRITAPTLLLWTDHDPTGGLDEAELLLELAPDARLHVIEDAGPLAAVGEARGVPGRPLEFLGRRSRAGEERRDERDRSASSACRTRRSPRCSPPPAPGDPGARFLADAARVAPRPSRTWRRTRSSSSVRTTSTPTSTT